MRVASVVILAIALTGCDRPRPLVICHNANCTGDTSPSNSDTIEGLRAALALTHDGRPLLDGVELDLLWDAPRDRCAFAHDAETAPTRASAGEAAAVLNTWPQSLATPFLVVLDAKPSADPAPLASCVVTIATSLSFGVTTGPDHSFQVFLSSGDPALLRAIADEQARRGLALPLTAGFASPRPLGNSPPLSAFAGIPLAGVSAHPRWLTDQQLIAMEDAGLAVFLWSHLLTVETLDTIERHQPYAVGTDDVELLRAWID